MLVGILQFKKKKSFLSGGYLITQKGSAWRKKRVNAGFSFTDQFQDSELESTIFRW